MNSEDIVISICCTTYNHEKYIRQCLDGFVMQKTNFAFEILVHDDASTDSTAVIVKEYSDNYPHLFRCVYQTENQFLKQNTLINILFKMAKGKYLAICEGDDYWTDSYKLQKQVDFLETNSKFNICFHNTLELFENNAPKSFNYCDFGSDMQLDFKQMIAKNYIPTCSAVFRNNTNWSTLPSEFFKSKFGDWYLHLLNIRNSKAWYINEVMGVHRLLNNSEWSPLTKTIQIKYIIETFNYFKITFYEEKLLIEDIQSKYILDYYYLIIKNGSLKELLLNLNFIKLYFANKIHKIFIK